MKANYQIRTGDFEYIMIEQEVESHGEAASGFRALKSAFMGSPGLGQKEFNQALDSYLVTHTMESSTYEGMSVFQQSVIQELKKSFKRTKNQ